MKMQTAGWFDTSKEGLAQIVRRKGMAFVLNELVQNAWDTNATKAVVTITPIPNRAAVTFHVFDDDPDGFKDLSHAYTLFAPSEKKGQADKRGRYNLGEKLVLAACSSASISTTTGTIHFQQEGKKLFRTHSKKKRAFGSVFEAVIPMTRALLEVVTDAADDLLPPIPTPDNDRIIPERKPIHTFTAQLPTETADAEGFLRRTRRKTEVRLYESFDGIGTTYLYEMGIPVVKVDLPWSVEIMQKIPLNADRDNTTPAYMRELGVLVVNEMHESLKWETAASPIVIEALGDERITPEAVDTILTHQYGKKRTIFDPSDPESNKAAVANGYNVIPGGAYGKGQWANIKGTEAAKPSSKMFPTPKCYDPNGENTAKTIPYDKWTEGMKNVAEFATFLAKELMDVDLHITMENEITQWYGANYGSGHLTFNVPRLGKKWFNLPDNPEKIMDLLIHEFGHEYASDHLSKDYYKALTKLGAKLTMLGLRRPGWFADYGIV